MKIKITFKTPDAVYCVLEDELATNYEDRAPSEADEEKVDGMRAEYLETINKFVKYGEQVTIEFDTKKDTATVMKVKR